MNNSNSARLIESIKFGDLVTVRRDDGGRSTGRAEQTATGNWRVRSGPLFSYPVTADNIVSITRRLS